MTSKGMISLYELMAKLGSNNISSKTMEYTVFKILKLVIKIKFVLLISCLIKRGIFFKRVQANQTPLNQHRQLNTVD